MFEKIAGMFLLQKSLSASASLIESLLVGMALIFMLGLMASILITALIIGTMYVFYHTLVVSGVAPLIASYIIGSVIVILLAAIIIITMLCIHKIKTIPKKLTMPDSRINRRITEVIDAFMDGFDATPAKG